jgi:hypothetical protein
MSEQEANEGNTGLPPVIEAFAPTYEALNTVVNETATHWQDSKKDEFYKAYISNYNTVGRNYLEETLNLLEMLEKARNIATELNSATSGFGVVSGGGTRWLSIMDISTIVRRETSRWFHGNGWGS